MDGDNAMHQMQITSAFEWWRSRRKRWMMLAYSFSLESFSKGVLSAPPKIFLGMPICSLTEVEDYVEVQIFDEGTQ